ncbi:CGNR zinc finger domain-containing protein [Saccharopolyspora sp. 6T]|uniref:CGNR zinc finger domain-containing protein n=1 Tax=Saccharopolyspora sp. 6T TaxID=2877238 RepID=UPI001CD2FEEA|nr:CGNR zinc finger domain-containing protein [Saccharopolyspora sp. 6T]MCA1186521.1 CGNR zinc finger domain-containing protein [Saccharopolyspora sp. 6T]
MVFVNSRAVADRVPANSAADLDAERDVELVLAFLNTSDAETGTDVLDSADQWRAWSAGRGLGEAGDRGSARRVREAMRAAVSCDRSAPRPDADVITWPVPVVLQDGVPVLGGQDALGRVLAAAVHLVHTGHWNRIKICPAEDCLWAFYDRSRNKSRTWCSMRVCGNREKARSWRERHATAE